MKFVCDRCKTRYSIADERVRGKILKIRCKNCANVITVREGMDADASAAARSRAVSGAPGPGASAPPAPPVLEEEWYVSIDGVQTGPLSRQDAQRWIASKPPEAELYCWSEGFDDWLPVDKVGHFRNLRKPRATRSSVPPPVPRHTARPVEDEPKPLFAATMAAIEKSGAGADSKLPPLGGRAAISAPATAKANGTGVGAAIPQTARGTASSPIPTGAGASASGRFSAQPQSAGAAALAQAFGSDSADAMTTVDTPAFHDEVATAAEPVAARRGRSNAFDLGSMTGAEPALPGPSAESATSAEVPSPPAAQPAARTVEQALESDDDDDLSIGEVSRVVKLADLVPKPKPARAPTLTGTGALPRVAQTGHGASQPRISPSDLGMNVDPGLLAQSGAPGLPAADESMVARSFAQRHRRGMLALIAVSGLLVLGVIGVVAFVLSKDTVEIGGGLGGTRQIDTSRPEDIVRRQLPPEPDTGSASTQTPTTATTTPAKPRPRPTGGNQVAQTIEEPTGNALRASEVEEMAAKQNEGTRRCYMRAQKGALGFEVASVKKIAVTLTVAKNGTVTDVQLSSHANDSFGQCLIARIKAWKFRESSSGGTFRISLAFSSS